MTPEELQRQFNALKTLFYELQARMRLFGFPDVQDALDSKADEADLQAHLDDTTDAHAGSAITNTPDGGISAATVQAAINELDTEKLAAILAGLASVLVTDPTTGAVTASAKLRFNETTGVFEIGGTPLVALNNGDVHQVAPDGISGGRFQYSFSDTPTVSPYIAFIRSRGTHDNPTAVLTGDVLGRIRVRPHDDSAWENTQAEIRPVAAEDHDGSGHGTKWEFYVTPNNSTTLTLALTINDDGSLTDGSGTPYGTGSGDISGTGVAGQVAEFVTNTKTLQAAKLIGPVTNILALTNAAAATLALNITAGKTLTLTAADNYTLTIPATGTVALLATQNIFTTQQQITIPTATLNGLVIKTSDNSETNNLLELQSSTGAKLIYMTGDGLLKMATTKAAPASGVVGNTISVTYGDNVEAKTVYFNRFSGKVDTTFSWNTVVYGNEFRLEHGTTNEASIYSRYSIFNAAHFQAIPSNATYQNAIAGFFELWAQNGSIITSGVAGDFLAYLTAGTVTNAIAGRFGVTKGSATLTNAYGIQVTDITGGSTLNKAIETSKGLVTFGDKTTITGWQDLNQLVVTGFTTQTLPTVHFIDNTATTNAIRNVLQLEARSTGTAAAGLGPGLPFYAETATNGTYQQQGLISTSWLVAANATRTTDMKFWTYDYNGARLGLAIESDGSAARIGVLGATPIVRQAHIVDADGNLADVTSKFNSLLAYLENFGFIAAS